MTRKAIIEDAIHFHRIKEILHINNVSSEKISNNGFLLGSSLQEYQFLIKKAFCLTSERDSAVVGFGILLPFSLLAKTDFWKKKDYIRWKDKCKYTNNEKIAYFEQLAFLPHNEICAIDLVMEGLVCCFSSGVDAIFTTVVKLPMPNLASPPLIRAFGGLLIGEIDESYPEIKKITSDVYIIERLSFQNSPLAKGLMRKRKYNNVGFDFF